MKESSKSEREGEKRECEKVRIDKGKKKCK